MSIRCLSHVYRPPHDGRHLPCRDDELSNADAGAKSSLSPSLKAMFSICADFATMQGGAHYLNAASRVS